MWLGQDDTMQGLGCGRGCQGAAGPLYQWVQGVDGLGNTVGFWRPTQRLHARRTVRAQCGAVPRRDRGSRRRESLSVGCRASTGWAAHSASGSGSRRLAKRALPLAQRIAPFVPGGAAALTVATPFLNQAGIAGLGESARSTPRRTVRSTRCRASTPTTASTGSAPTTTQRAFR